MQQLFQLAPVAYIVTTYDGSISRVNSAACALLGRPVNALVGKPLACYVELGERMAFRTAFSRSRASSEVEEWSIRLTPKDSTPLDCRVRVRAIRPSRHGTASLAWVVTPGAEDPLDEY